MYSTPGEEREIVKEETVLRKEKEAVCCYMYKQAVATLYVHIQWHTCYSTIVRVPDYLMVE